MHGLELGLLILESALLVFTIILLIVSLKEGRGRDKLIKEVGNATRVLTRHEYFITVIDSMMDAKKEVLASITGRMPTTDDDIKRTKELSYNIEKLVAQGVSVKYILPKFQDRLNVGWLYHKAGAEVFYSPCVSIEDFRYTVVDSNVAVIGVPNTTGQKIATRKGYKIPSVGLATMLRENIMSCQQQLSFEDYIKETLKHTGNNTEALAREIKVDESEIKKIISN